MIAVKFYIRFEKDIDLLFNNLRDYVKNFFDDINFLDDIEYVDLDENKFYDYQRKILYKSKGLKVKEELLYKIDLRQFTYWGFVINNKNNVEEKLKMFFKNMKKKDICLIIGYREIDNLEEITEFYKEFANYIDEKINVIDAIPAFIRVPPCEVVKI